MSYVSDYIKEFFKVNLKEVLHKKVEKLLNVSVVDCFNVIIIVLVNCYFPENVN